MVVFYKCFFDKMIRRLSFAKMEVFYEAQQQRDHGAIFMLLAPFLEHLTVFYLFIQFLLPEFIYFMKFGRRQ